MAVHRLSRCVRQIRRITLPDEAGVSDCHLLGQFIERQDEFAFAALVKRHGPMVWDVCRRIAVHHQDAEDAFQATFLVLARKALSIRPREMVANWLFGVAQRTGRKARTMAAKRCTREKLVSSMPEPPAAILDPADGLESVIDQELASLPDKYRVAIVLCDLEGKKGKDVARHLKIPHGTLASRLRTARAMLAKRLARHGIAVAGGAAAIAMAPAGLSAGAAPRLVSATIQAATQMAAGKTVAAGTVSASAVALMEGVLKAMLLTTLRRALTVLLVLGAIAFGGGLLAQHTAFGRQVPGANQVGDKSARLPVAPPLPALPEKAIQAREEKVDCITTYQVADLVVPIDGLDDAPDLTKKERLPTKEAWLIKKITTTVSPDSWTGAGGTGTIDYHPVGMALVVSNTPQVQARVRYLLETMRRVQEVEIGAETRFIALNAVSFQKLQRFLPELEIGGSAILSEVESFALLRKVRDFGDCKVIQAPKVTFLPGQRIDLSLDLGKEMPAFGKTELKLKAMVAANLRHLELEVKATVGKAKFSSVIWMEEGATLAQVRRNGDDFMIILVTPRVILALGEEKEVVPPKAGQLPK